MTPDEMLPFFGYNHLSMTVRPIARIYVPVAHEVMKLPDSPDRTIAMEALLKSRDAAIRAVLFK